MVTPKTEDEGKALWILSSLAWKGCGKKQTAWPLNHTITHNKLRNSCQSYGSLLSLILRIYFKIGHYLLKGPSLQSIILSLFVVPSEDHKSNSSKVFLLLRNSQSNTEHRTENLSLSQTWYFSIYSQVFIHVLYIFTNFPTMSLIPGENKEGQKDEVTCLMSPQLINRESRFRFW